MASADSPIERRSERTNPSIVPNVAASTSGLGRYSKRITGASVDHAQCNHVRAVHCVNRAGDDGANSSRRATSSARASSNGARNCVPVTPIRASAC